MKKGWKEIHYLDSIRFLLLVIAWVLCGLTALLLVGLATWAGG